MGKGVSSAQSPLVVRSGPQKLPRKNLGPISLPAPPPHLAHLSPAVSKTSELSNVLPLRPRGLSTPARTVFLRAQAKYMNPTAEERMRLLENSREGNSCAREFGIFKVKKTGLWQKCVLGANGRKPVPQKGVGFFPQHAGGSRRRAPQWGRNRELLDLGR